MIAKKRRMLMVEEGIDEIVKGIDSCSVPGHDKKYQRSGDQVSASQDFAGHSAIYQKPGYQVPDIQVLEIQDDRYDSLGSQSDGCEDGCETAKTPDDGYREPIPADLEAAVELVRSKGADAYDTLHPFGIAGLQIYDCIGRHGKPEYGVEASDGLHLCLAGKVACFLSEKTGAGSICGYKMKLK